MESTQYIVFSFYYINTEGEIDKILKYKYVLRKDDILTHQELYSEITRHKHMYHSPVALHEVLMYRNTDECIEMEQYETEHLFQHINYMKDVNLHNDRPLQELDRIYVFFRSKSSPFTSTHSHKKSIRNNIVRSSSKYTRRALL